jgi:hypothetical protein
LSTGKYCHVHGKSIPDSVIENLRSINPISVIGFEGDPEGAYGNEDLDPYLLVDVHSMGTALRRLQLGEGDTVDHQAIAQEYWDHIMEPNGPLEAMLDAENEVNLDNDFEHFPVIAEESDVPPRYSVGTFGQGRYPDRVRRRPDYLSYVLRTFAMTYERALKLRKESAEAALGIELDTIDLKRVWPECKVDWLTLRIVYVC